MRIDAIPIHEMNQDVMIRKIEESTSLNFDGLHRHNFYEILFFTHSGGSSHYIDFEEQPVKCDCIYLLKPGQAYKMELVDQKGFLLAIKAERFDLMRSELSNYLYYIIPSVIMLDEKDLKLAEQVITSVYEELSGKRRREIITAHINTLITLCILFFKDTIKESGIDDRVLILIELIDTHYMTERELTFYANKISLSEKRLGAITKQSLGFTVKQLIQKRILLEAKRLVGLGNHPLKSVSFQLGFKDTSYFSRFFKTYSGLTPEQFRNTLK